MYCGCGTKLNKTLWTVVTLFGLLTIGLWIAFGALWAPCSDALERRNCVNENQYSYDSDCVRDVYNDEGRCYASQACFYLGILALIAATLPLYIMCCCSPKPRSHKHDVGHANYQAYDAPTAAPAYNQPAYDQPVYEQPAYDGGKYDSYGGGNSYGNSYGTSGNGYGQPAHHGGFTHGTQGTDVYDQYGSAPPAGGYRG